ncbi:MAG: GIY-YIG nuclease family protein [Melioribacteraceae bacterium]
MQWFTYIIYSPSTDKYYVGHTHNLTLRLERHNSGNSRSTKHGIPWEIVYFESYASKSEAIKREYEIKRMKSRKYIEQLIKK